METADKVLELESVQDFWPKTNHRRKDMEGKRRPEASTSSRVQKTHLEGILPTSAQKIPNKVQQHILKSLLGSLEWRESQRPTETHVYQKNFTHTNEKLKSKRTYSEMWAAYDQEVQAFCGANAYPSAGTRAQTFMVRGRKWREDGILAALQFVAPRRELKWSPGFQQKL